MHRLVDRGGRLRGEEDATKDLDEEFLGVPCAEVEADGFEDEAFEADDDLAGVLEHLFTPN